ncbi:hypothetical protein Goarm_004071 [Gossypium armourianum]|uniref:DUF674 domain-containing protein n=2 Tax=Gossypium TaxID=3633 RepID=A0A7J9K5F0_9ROSI|nr:hypothetical protein [Gossypium armourianum]
MAANTISLKLLVDSTSQRVLFAESGKEFVDFMFNILSLPVGTVIRLLTKEQMVGSLGNLYDSLENMNDTYILSPANKDTLLKPIVPNNAANVPPFCGLYVANDSKSVCPSCNNVMTQTATIMNPRKGSSTNEGGYVKGVVTYMIMDDLVVTPMSAISCFTLLNKFNIKDVGVLEEKTINIGIDERSPAALASAASAWLGLHDLLLDCSWCYMLTILQHLLFCKQGVKLLKASLQSKTVLTDAFLKKKAGESDASSSSGVHSIVI